MNKQRDRLTAWKDEHNVCTTREERAILAKNDELEVMRESCVIANNIIKRLVSRGKAKKTK